MAEFESLLRSETPDLDKRVDKLHKQARKAHYKIKFMTVVFKISLYDHKCEYPKCPKTATHAAVVLANIRENRDAISAEKHYDEWRISADMDHYRKLTFDRNGQATGIDPRCGFYVPPRALRYSPKDTRTKERMVCAYHARKDMVGDCFPFFLKNGLNGYMESTLVV